MEITQYIGDEIMGTSVDVSKLVLDTREGIKTFGKCRVTFEASGLVIINLPSGIQNGYDGNDIYTHVSRIEAYA